MVSIRDGSAVSNQAYSLSVDSRVPLLGFIGALCFGHTLSQNPISEEPADQQLVRLGQLWEVVPGVVSVGHKLAEERVTVSPLVRRSLWVRFLDNGWQWQLWGPGDC